ncbi:MAG TPA: hypothetical protein VMF66_02810 [Candidatus Acidoferrum sp.]|nr:hypothetical protein [Candidatus Acidoferrum sp.]
MRVVSSFVFRSLVLRAGAIVSAVPRQFAHHSSKSKWRPQNKIKSVSLAALFLVDYNLFEILITIPDDTNKNFNGTLTAA